MCDLGPPLSETKVVRSLMVEGCYVYDIQSSSFYIYIPWPFPPVWGVADNTKEQRNNGDFTPFF